MNNGIEVEVIWLDQNVVEFPFSSSNGRFSGHAEIYVSHDKLSDVAEGLSGFPSHTKDSRDFELGTFNPTMRTAEFGCISAARIRRDMRW